MFHMEHFLLCSGIVSRETNQTGRLKKSRQGAVLAGLQPFKQGACRVEGAFTPADSTMPVGSGSCSFILAGHLCIGAANQIKDLLCTPSTSQLPGGSWGVSRGQHRKGGGPGGGESKSSRRVCPDAVAIAAGSTAAVARSRSQHALRTACGRALHGCCSPLDYTRGQHRSFLLGERNGPFSRKEPLGTLICPSKSNHKPL